MLLDTSSTCRLADGLRWLRSRYDGDAVAPSVFGIIKKIEVELAWREHAADLRRGADHPTA